MAELFIVIPVMKENLTHNHENEDGQTINNELSRPALNETSAHTPGGARPFTVRYRYPDGWLIINPIRQLNDPEHDRRNIPAMANLRNSIRRSSASH